MEHVPLASSLLEVEAWRCEGERVGPVPKAAIWRLVWSCMKREYADRFCGGGGEAGIETEY